MKISEMSVEQKREYNTQVKRNQRNREEAERIAALTPSVRDYQLDDDTVQEFETHARAVCAQINKEVPNLAESPEVIACIWVVRGFEQQIIKQCIEGVLVAGYHCDALASELIELVHRQPDMLLSVTFKQLFGDLLKAVVKFADKNHCTAEFIRDCRDELNNCYVLKYRPPPVHQPVPAPDVVPVIRIAPSVQKFVPVIVQLPFEPYLSPAARRFLDNGI